MGMVLFYAFVSESLQYPKVCSIRKSVVSGGLSYPDFSLMAPADSAPDCCRYQMRADSKTPDPSVFAQIFRHLLLHRQTDRPPATAGVAMAIVARPIRALPILAQTLRQAAFLSAF
jgi:hypothetical protein